MFIVFAIFVNQLLQNRYFSPLQQLRQNGLFPEPYSADGKNISTAVETELHNKL